MSIMMNINTDLRNIILYIIMFKYNYLICTKPSGKKYWTRKYIYMNDVFYSFEDNKYSMNQLNKLISSLNQDQYKKIYSNVLPTNINEGYLYKMNNQDKE